MGTKMEHTNSIIWKDKFVFIVYHNQSFLSHEEGRRGRPKKVEIFKNTYPVIYGYVFYFIFLNGFTYYNLIHGFLKEETQTHLDNDATTSINFLAPNFIFFFFMNPTFTWTAFTWDALGKLYSSAGKLSREMYWVNLYMMILTYNYFWW